MEHEDDGGFLQPRIPDTPTSLLDSSAAALEKQLYVLHPGYDTLNTLLQLPLTDNGAVDYDTALTICGIICGNTFSTGWFANDRQGLDCIAVGTPLEDTVYYFADQGDRRSRYPVCTSFWDWQLPRTPDLPKSLRDLECNYHTLIPYGNDDQVRFRDRSCRVSNTYDGTEWAHLIPREAGPWWAREVAPTARTTLAGPENAILLRKDLHFLLDQKTWTPMMKAGKLVVHVTDATSRGVSVQFQSQWHNRQMQEIRGVDKRFILARVAWTVIPLLSNFLYARGQAAETTFIKRQGDIMEWSPKQCAKVFDVRARSRSPKRKQSQLDDEALDQDGYPTDTDRHDVKSMVRKRPSTNVHTLASYAAIEPHGLRSHEITCQFTRSKRKRYSSEQYEALISPATTPSVSPPRGRNRNRISQSLT